MGMPPCVKHDPLPAAQWHASHYGHTCNAVARRRRPASITNRHQRDHGMRFYARTKNLLGRGLSGPTRKRHRPATVGARQPCGGKRILDFLQ